jgi:hypothetical protein
MQSGKWSTKYAQTTSEGSTKSNKRLSTTNCSQAISTDPQIVMELQPSSIAA